MRLTGDPIGPVFTYSMLNQPVIVISSVKAAADVLDRLSHVTSDRPPLIKLNEYLCRNNDFGFQPLNEV